MLRALRRHGSELWIEASCLFGGRYPKFVTARAPESLGDSVPAFVFHTIEPEEFEAQLAFLAENGYHTATCDEFLRHLAGECRLPERSVLLTIDDGRRSVWTYGYPLLKKYGFRAVVFLIPGYVEEGNGLPPNLEDVWAGRRARSDLCNDDPTLMTWTEIDALQASGVIDFQSHTLHHHRVPTGARVVDFVRPGMGEALFDIVVPTGSEPLLRERGAAAFYGAPIRENDSLMAGRPRFREADGVAQACVEHVAANGGEGFFRTRDWREELSRIVREREERVGAAGVHEDPRSLREAMLHSLAESRRLIEERLGTEVRHLCYPYTIGSDMAVALSREAGYRTNFWGAVSGRRGNAPGDDPFRCTRLKGDYVFRLPGRGRKPLAAIFRDKATRRASGRAVY
jgi:peptidoglycan/xylan/chitin deacetylase (PgdA/CDA1 family)